MFEQKESIAHKAAKEQLAKWLRETGPVSPFLFPDCDYKVFEEKPIAPQGWPLFVPDITIEVDLEYLELGKALYFIEIVHTNRVSEEKMQRIESFASSQYYVEVWEVDVKDILHLIFDNPPNHIKASKIFLKTNRNEGTRIMREGDRFTRSDFPELPEPKPKQPDQAKSGTRFYP